MNVLLRRFGLVLLAVLFGCSGSGVTPERDLAGDASTALSANATKVISILHVNDTHSTLDAIGTKQSLADGVLGTLGGLTKAATVIERVRGGNAKTLLLHAGDVFEGDLTFATTNGVLELQLLQQLGLDAMTVGNHELHYGPDLLAHRLATANLTGIPVLAANLQIPAAHPLAGLVTGETVKDVGGIRVGIFGLTLPPAEDPLVWLPEDSGVSVTAEVGPIVVAEVAKLRSPPLSADVVILLSHLGPTANQTIAARTDNGIDFIIAGHDESLQTFQTYEPGRTAIVEAGNFYRYVGRLDVTVRKGAIIAAQHSLIPIDSDVQRDRVVASAVRSAQTEANTALGFDPLGIDAFRTPVAVATGDFPNLRSAEALPRLDVPMGALAADAIKSQLEVALGLTTSGFLNDKLYAGEIVPNDLFHALPYGINAMQLGAPFEAVVPSHPMVRIEMSGAQLWYSMLFALALGEVPQVSHGTVVCYAPYEDNVVPAVLLVNGTQVTNTSTDKFTVGVNVFLAGMINQVLYSQGLPTVELPTSIDPSVSQFSVLLEHVVEQQLVTPAPARVILNDEAACMAALANAAT